MLGTGVLRSDFNLPDYTDQDMATVDMELPGGSDHKSIGDSHECLPIDLVGLEAKPRGQGHLAPSAATPDCSHTRCVWHRLTPTLM